MALPFMAGKNADIIVTRGPKKVVLKARTWSWKQRGVEAEDNVGGEDRARYQTIVDGYDIDVEALMENMAELDVLLDDTHQRDTRTAPVEIGVGFLIKPNDGSRKGYAAIGAVLALFEYMGNPGRTERQTMRVPFKAQDIINVATV